MRFTTCAIIAAILLLIAFAGGCRSTVKGGTAKHDTGAFRAFVPTPSGTVEIYDDRENVSTTQPTVETNTGQLPKIDGAKEGELGGVSLAALPPVRRDNLILGGAMIALGLAFLFVPLIRQPGTGAILIAAGILTTLYPWVVAVGAVVALIWFAYHKGMFTKRLVTSVDHAMTTELSPAEREGFKATMAEKQNVSDVKTVKALKAKTE